MLLGIIHEEKKVIYWGIPKAGVTTMKTFLAKEMNLDYSQIHGKDIGFKYTDTVKDGYFNFSYVRNPYNRIMSLYNEKIIERIDRVVFPNEKLFYQEMPFKDFLIACKLEEKKNRHYVAQSELIPNGVFWYKIENDLFMKMQNKLNKSKHKDYWTIETREMVLSMYKNDFTAYGYETD